MTALAGVFDRVVEMTWQAAVLALAVLVVQRLFARRLSPGFRYALWWLVVARLVLPVLPVSPVSAWGLVAGAPPEPAAVAAPETPAPADASPGPADPANPAPRTATTAVVVGPPERPVARTTTSPEPAGEANLPALVWLAGALGLAGLTAFRQIRFFRRLRTAGAAPPDVAALADACRRAAGIRRQVPVLFGDGVPVPAAVGAIRPRIVLPPDVLADLDEEELRLVLQHEMEHVRRRDGATGWLLTAVRCVHWMNPVAWLALSRLAAERETVRDLAAIRRRPGTNGRAYGRLILKLARVAGPVPRAAPLVAIFERKNDIRRRITMIVSFTDRPRRGLVLGAVLAVLLTAGGLTAAQEPETQEPPKPGRTVDTRPADDNPRPDSADPEETPDRIRVVPRPEPDPKVAALRKKLRETKVSCSFDEAPLREVVSYFQALTGTNIMISPAAASAGAESVTLIAKEITLGQALELATRDLELYVGTIPSVVYVTTPGDPRTLERRVYNVEPLFDEPAPKDDGDARSVELFDLIGEYVHSRSWGMGEISMRYWDGLFVVRQTPEAHREIEAFLNALLHRSSAPAPVAAVPPGLEREVSVTFEQADLGTAARTVAERAGVTVVVDPVLAADSGPVTLKLEGVPALSALRLLAQYGSGEIVVEGGTVLLGYRRQVEIRVYDVADLVADRDASEFEDLVHDSVAPDSWDGDQLRRDLWCGRLVVSQTRAGHEELAEFLDALRRARK